MNDLELFFKVRGPGYNLIQYINHLPEYSKDGEKLSKVIEEIRNVESLKSWIQQNSVPKDCRVDLRDTVLFDAFAQYVTSFFSTSLELKRKIVCSQCQLSHYLIGPAKLTPESRKKATKLLTNTIEQYCLDLNVDVPDMNSSAAFYADLVYVTYVLQSAKRIKHKAAGGALHVLWQRLEPEQKKNISMQAFRKHEARLKKSLQSHHNP